MNDKFESWLPKTTWWQGGGKYDRQHAARHDGGGGGLQRAAGRELFRKHRPDVTLLDLRMPAWRGGSGHGHPGGVSTAKMVALTTYAATKTSAAPGRGRTGVPDQGRPAR